MSIAIPTGVFDILPEDPKEAGRESHLWNYLETVFRAHATAYGCHEIRTPIFERTELFTRSVGDETDIVSKEMYTFEDRGGRSISLRPEGTAPVMRAFIEKQLHAQSHLHRFFYLGPIFRYERPQSGRFRQHHQFGVEVIGSPHPEADAEMIEMLYSLLKRLGIQHVNVYINSLGDKAAREQFRNALCAYLKPHLPQMSEESQRRFTTNPLRILDSKDERDKEVVSKAPSILEFLSEESRVKFECIQKILRHLDIPFQVNDRLVRGLDYYNNTVFEFTSGHLGAQNSIAGGGRYDGLLKALGGPDLSSIGFGSGIERIIQVLLQQKQTAHLQRPKPALYVIALGEAAGLAAMTLVARLRKEGITALLDLSRKKVKACMQEANALGAEYALVLGDNELQQQRVELKHMPTARVVPMSLEAVPFFLQMQALSGRLYSDFETMQNACTEVCRDSHLVEEHMKEQFSHLAQKATTLLNSIKR